MTIYPTFGDYNNTFDNTVSKNIDILRPDDVVDNTIASTEWFAEFAFAGIWRVNPDWLAANPPVDEP